MGDNGTILKTTTTTEIQQTKEANKLASVYPNPCIDNLFLELEQPQNNAFVVLYDATGKVLLQQVIDGTKTSLNLSSFAAGVYVYELRGEGGVLEKGLVNVLLR